MGDMLSQAEINALLGGNASNSETQEEKPDDTKNIKDTLTNEEKDILGEIGNISMGTSATTLFALLREKVLITTPCVNVVKWADIAKGYDRPCVGIKVDYKEGIEGSNVLLLKDRDVKIISNLMMGGDGTEDVDGELNEIDLSAIAEAMNQMVGSASTSLASLVKMRIDIDTPRAFLLDFNDDSFYENVSFADEEIVCISFRMEIGTIIDSEIMQVLPMKFAIEMVNVMKSELQAQKSVQSKQDITEKAPPVQPQEPQDAPTQKQSAPPQTSPPQQYHAPQPRQPTAQQNINVQPAQFQSFDVSTVMQQKENIGIIMDVPLEVTVELGRTSKKIKEILEFSPGTIVELDKLAGEPIDILVNGKFVAKGEVVVIDENFGIRIIDIINAENRI